MRKLNYVGLQQRDRDSGPLPALVEQSRRALPAEPAKRDCLR
jgi:hypothetical protein